MGAACVGQVAQDRPPSILAAEKRGEWAIALLGGVSPRGHVSFYIVELPCPEGDSFDCSGLVSGGVQACLQMNI